MPFSEIQKILQLHQVSIDKLIGFLNCKNIDSLCPNYTYNLLECRVQLEHIKGYLAEKKCHLALWGAGKFGVNVIKAFQEVDLFLISCMTTTLHYRVRIMNI